MNSIEICIGNQKYVIRGEEGEEHLREVAEMVRRRVDTIKKKSPSLSLQKAAMLAAFDFASDVIKHRRKTSDTRSTILTKAHSLLERVERELETKI